MAICSSQNTIVDQMANIVITGNVIPQNWYRAIVKPTGKPYVEAIMILADIVYWYRPTEVRDEMTGQTTRLQKKFHGDLLQRSYQQISDQFGISKRQAARAVVALEELGVIRREFRDLKINGRSVNNVMYLELIPGRLQELTNPIQGDNESMSPILETPDAKNDDRTIGKMETDHSGKCDTNTKISPEINNKEYSILSYQEELEHFKKQIDYDAIRLDMPYQAEQLDEIVSLAVEVLTTTKETIRVNKEERQTYLVQAQFRKLNMGHIRYVLDCLAHNTTEVRNIKAMLITSLYNAVLTMGSYYMARVQHDMYGN
ncbi:hypothetical protein EV209_0946 [Cuneatibacter caecimuris]|uniref:DUF6017 domain-containing protein n=2 Tax=Cuneatibacter caecimuris TaxID=1796618 RepID=A0A4Q7PP92_9FIRM|nr:hypothetical protein EV209_0946 [Cuneatibacter caecimuris]